MPFDTIAIIPAKHISTRIPSKNLLRLADKPLFLHSVQYARNEGVEPVVSTDSPEIIRICEENKIRYVQETVNESNMFFCIKHAADQFQGVKDVVVLQPTSPFRRTTLLREMLASLHDGNYHSVYTSSKLKTIGHLDGKFQYAYRDQDTQRWFHQFDGNIIVVDVAKMNETQALFSDNSLYFDEEYPYTLQVDTPVHWAIMNGLVKMPSFRHALPMEKKPSIVIVSNKAYYHRDYSKFVDSCDIVVRINNMANYGSGLSGKKTDIAVVGVNSYYLGREKDASHIDVALNVPVVYVHYVQSECAREFLDMKPKGDVMFLPWDVKTEGAEWTTFGRAVKIMRELYPDVTLKLLADKHVANRSDATLCQLSTEDSVLDVLEAQGKIEYVLEEDEQDEYKYSEPIPDNNVPYKLRSDLVKNYDAVEGEEIECISPQWMSTVKIVDGICCRKDNTFCGWIKEWKGDNLTIYWDGMAEEPFVRKQDSDSGRPTYVSVIPTGKSLYR